MKAEVQVAVDFLVGCLYNKLPRRRVNVFAEEVSKNLKIKFDGHWYPEKPFKGSGFRCVRVSDTLDPVIENAARDSGLNLDDVKANLPQELSIWIDPREVSYRVGEKGSVKVLYTSDRDDPEPTSSLNPEATTFKPIEPMPPPSLPSPTTEQPPAPIAGGGNGGGVSPGAPPGPFPGPSNRNQPLTFTTEAFALTKFGSTKLKNAGKKVNTSRMSPTEFTAYMKQRAAQMHSQNKTRSLSPYAKEFVYPKEPSPNTMMFGDSFSFLQAGATGGGALFDAFQPIASNADTGPANTAAGWSNDGWNNAQLLGNYSNVLNQIVAAN